MSAEPEISLTVNGLDLTTLDDDDLFSRLKGLGATVGPIVDSTRKVYQRKLAVLMGGDVPESQYNGDVDQDEDCSDSETGNFMFHCIFITLQTCTSGPVLAQKFVFRPGKSYLQGFVICSF